MVSVEPKRVYADIAGIFRACPLLVPASEFEANKLIC